MKKRNQLVTKLENGYIFGKISGKISGKIKLEKIDLKE
jgi:hypothetical protein